MINVQFQRIDSWLIFNEIENIIFETSMYDIYTILRHNF